MKNLAAITLFVLSCSFLNAQKVDYFDSDGVAIKGFDPVAYFIEGAAIEGTKQFSYSWQDTEWRIKNHANPDAFNAKS